MSLSLFFSFYFCFIIISFSYRYIRLIDDYLFLLLAFLTPYLSPVCDPCTAFTLWPCAAPNRLLCDACETCEILWWLNKVKVEEWWLFLFKFLGYFCYLVSLRCYWGSLFLELASFGVGFFFLLLLSFFSIQNWLLSIFFLFC